MLQLRLWKFSHYLPWHLLNFTEHVVHFILWKDVRCCVYYAAWIPPLQGTPFFFITLSRVANPLHSGSTTGIRNLDVRQVDLLMKFYCKFLTRTWTPPPPPLPSPPPTSPAVRFDSGLHWLSKYSRGSQAIQTRTFVNLFSRLTLTNTSLL